MGIMRTLVAVLEIHMDKNMVGSMKPSINIRGEVPNRESTDKAILQRICSRDGYNRFIEKLRRTK